MTFAHFIQMVGHYFWTVDHPFNLVVVIIFGLWVGYVQFERRTAIPPVALFWMTTLPVLGVEFLMTVVWALRGFGVPAVFTFLLWLPLWVVFFFSLVLGVAYRKRCRQKRIDQLTTRTDGS